MSDAALSEVCPYAWVVVIELRVADAPVMSVETDSGFSASAAFSDGP